MSVLSMRKNTNTTMVYFKTGRLSMKDIRLSRNFKYWFKLLRSENCILKICYDMMYDKCEQSRSPVKKWVCNIKHELFEIGLDQVCCEQDYLHFATHYPQQRLAENLIQNLVEQINFLSSLV